MSGYLQRLAARALGVAKPVRTSAAMPFSGGVPLVDAAVVVEAPAAEPADGVPRTADAPTIDAPVATATPSGRRTASAQRTDETDRQPTLAGREPPTPNRRQTMMARHGASSVDDGETTAEAETAWCHDAPPRLMPAIAAEANAMAAVADRLRSIPDTVDDQSRGTEVPARIEPPRLMPRQRPRPSQWVPPGSPRQAGIDIGVNKPAAMSEETVEVHVNIGRIEITAVPEAPAPKPAPRHRQQPMSLDEYVSRRRGSRS
jgi:hypothetical protein